MIAELDKLEARIAEAAETIRMLREQNRQLSDQMQVIEDQHRRFSEETGPSCGADYATCGEG